MALTEDGIKKVLEVYGASYIGRFDLERGSMDVTIMGDVFYQPNPDTSKGHTHYFALFHHPLTEDLLITNASFIVDREYPAIKFGEDDYLVSRGRHDYVSRDGVFLDGGASYTRCNPDHPPTHTMRVVDGVEVYEEINAKGD